MGAATLPVLNLVARPLEKSVAKQTGAVKHGRAPHITTRSLSMKANALSGSYLSTAK